MAESNQEPNKTNPQAVLVIEDDEAVQNVIAEPIRREGVAVVDCIADGNEAWQQAKTNSYDFIILDWKLPSAGGVALLNRFRRHQLYAKVPILVISGYLKKVDFSLLDEFPLTGRLEKPFRNQFLIHKIKDLLKEARWYDKQEETVTKLFATLSTDRGDVQATTASVIEFAKHAPQPLPILLAAVRIVRSQGAFAIVETLVQEGLKLAGDSALLLNEQGKALLATKQFKEARRILEKAQQISPQNLERLCALGQVSLSELDTDRARSYFADALDVDDADEDAQRGAELTENVSQYLTKTSVTNIPNSFAGLLNAIGIAMVRSGDFAEGVEHYKSAMRYVPDDEAKAKLSFNLGLGYLRWRKPEEALPWFRHATTYSPTFEKAQGYIVKIETSLGNDENGAFAIDQRADVTLPHELQAEAQDGGFVAEPIATSDLTEPVSKSASDEPFSPLASKADIAEQVLKGPQDGEALEEEALPMSDHPGEPIDGIDAAEGPDQTAETATEPDAAIAAALQNDPLSPLDKLNLASPEFSALIKQLAETGRAVESELIAFLALLDQHGVEDFAAGVKIALNKSTPLAEDLAAILGNRDLGDATRQSA